MIQLWSAAAVIGNKHCFTRCCGGEDISFVLKHISAVLCLLVVSSYLSTNPQWGGQKCKESTQVRNMSLQFGWNGLHPRDTQIVGLLGQEKIEILLLHPPLNMGRAHHLMRSTWEKERKTEEQKTQRGERVMAIPTSFPPSCLFLPEREKIGIHGSAPQLVSIYSDEVKQLL